jgi:hypothetical protein
MAHLMRRSYTPWRRMLTHRFPAVGLFVRHYPELSNPELSDAEHVFLWWHVFLCWGLMLQGVAARAQESRNPFCRRIRIDPTLLIRRSGYQIKRKPSCIVRLPPLNWWLLRKRLPEVTKIYPELSGLAFVF